MEDKFENQKDQRASHFETLAKEKTLLQKLEHAARLRNLEKHSEESLDWFRVNVGKMVGRQRAQKAVIREQPYAKGIGRNTPIGKMFTYAYDPKWKDTLPYYDRFPLGFYVGPAKNGFYMLNLHYLPPRQRAIFFDILLDLTNNPKYSPNTKLKLTYNLLVSSKKYKLFKPCFKHYLVKHVKTKVVEIPYDEWEAAMFLPLADFAKASATHVWSESMLGIYK